MVKRITTVSRVYPFKKPLDVPDFGHWIEIPVSLSLDLKARIEIPKLQDWVLRR